MFTAEAGALPHALPDDLLQTDLAIAEYEKAVELQQGYVTAWNNLGDAYEKAKMWRWVGQLWQHAACCCVLWQRLHALSQQQALGSQPCCSQLCVSGTCLWYGHTAAAGKACLTMATYSPAA